MNREDIISKLERIETKLDEVIKALHEYDDDQIQHCEYSGLPSVKAYDEEAANKRMDIIGQNGNEGSHYVTNKEADEDARHNTQTKHVGKKKRNERNNVIPDFKHTPPPPNPKRKSAIVEHQKYPPHKH